MSDQNSNEILKKKSSKTKSEIANSAPEVNNVKKSKRKLDDETSFEEIAPKKKKTSKQDVTLVEMPDTEVVPRKRTRSMDLTEVTPAEITLSPDEFRQKHQITISGTAINGEKYICPPPMTSFTSTPFGPNIMRSLKAAGFEAPTPTQAQAWPIALSGRDVITVAKTGSGKTCGFLLPAIHRLLNSSTPRKRGPPSILVLAPTRELACQIEEECVKFGSSSNMKSTCCYGGAPKSMQIRQLQMGVDILIATPGRLNDLMEMRCAVLSSVCFLVLDEADRMLDMGFEPQIRTIINAVPCDRQTMMFTATWPREIQNLAKDFLNNHVEVKFGDIHSLNANKAIKQVIRFMREGEKSEALKTVLKEINPTGEPEKIPKTIIFVSRKAGCDDLANDLWQAGYHVDSLHGDKQQYLRTKVMDQFKTGKLHILVATDVAARGLDVKDIGVVINYDFPVGQSGVEDYVHRIGRTARGGAEGSAYTFFTPDDGKRASQLIGVLRRADQEIPEELARMDRGGGGGFGGRGGFGRGGGRARVWRQRRRWRFQTATSMVNGW